MKLTDFRPEDIREVIDKGYAPLVWLKSGVVRPIDSDQELIRAFCDYHRVRITSRYDAWGDLLEPYVDTEFTPEHDALCTARLVEHGISVDEIKEIRNRVEAKILAYNAVVWDWVYLGLGDLYRSYTVFPSDFVEWTSEIARRSWTGTGELQAYASITDKLANKFNLDLLPTVRLDDFDAQVGRIEETDRICEFVTQHMSGRPYHNITHIEEALRFGLASFHSQWKLFGRSRQRALTWAILFHDVVYVPGASDNEARSAEIAYEKMMSYGLKREAKLARELILWTKHHDRSLARSAAFKAMYDADMGIFGASPQRYDEYVRGVRAEYAAFTDEQWRSGRLKFLESVLEREKASGRSESEFYFALNAFHSKLAHENIAREIQGLKEAP